MRSPTKGLTALALLCAVTPGLASGATKFVSPAANHPLVIDGDWADWDGLPIVYLEAGLRIVSVSHDDDNIFVMFRFGDERLAQLLLHRGVLLWFNGNGKAKHKDEAFGVRYVGSQEIADSIGAAKSETQDDDSARRPAGLRGLAHLRPQPGELTVIRFGVKDIVLEGLLDGPEAASAVHDGVYCFELRIPLDEIGGRVADRPPTNTRKIALGFQIGGTTTAERESIEAAIEDALGRGGGPAVTAGGVGRRGGGTGGRPPGGPPGKGVGDGRTNGAGRSQAKDRLNPPVEWLIVELTPPVPSAAVAPHDGSHPNGEPASQS